MVKLYMLIALCVIVLGLSCKKDLPPEPPRQSSIRLSVEDVSCTEAWLKVSLTDGNEPRTVAIQQDGQRVLTARMTSSDSLLVVEGLLPRHSYTFLAQRLRDSAAIDASSSVQATTMDTTSHQFQFRIDTLGATASVLSDVAIINDTLAYAVGEMYLRDSTGQIDPQAYNMAKWDGNRWHIMRIQFYTICGQSSRTPYPAKSVFAFGANDIWIAMNGDQVARWNGTTQTSTMCLPVSFSINKLWGESANSVYAVGAGGNIMHYTNSTWRRVESGTSVYLTDVWGTPDGREVWACGFNDSNGGSVVLRLANGTWQTLWDRRAPPRPPFIYVSYLSSLWSSGSGEFVVVGGRFYRNSLLDINIVRNEYIYRPDGSSYIFQLGNFAYRVRGSQRNDVTLVGDYAMVWHWNGATWRKHDELYNSEDRLYGLAVSPTMIVAVGTRYYGIFRNGLVLRGRR